MSAHLLFDCSQGVSPGRGCRHGVISAHCWLRADLRSSGDQHTEESWELSAPAFLSSSLRSWTHPWISPASSLAPLTYGLCLRLQEHGYPVLLNLMVSPEVSPHWAPSSASLPLLPLLFCKEKSSDRTRAGAVPSLSFLTSMEFSPCGKLCLQEPKCLFSIRSREAGTHWGGSPVLRRSSSYVDQSINLPQLA